MWFAAIESSIEQLASERKKETPNQPLQLRSHSGEETESNISTPPPSERPVLEEFVPLKKRWERQEQEHEQEKIGQVSEVQEKCIERPRSSSNGMPAWMAEAQLWTHHQQNPTSQEPSSQARSLRPEDSNVSFGFEEHTSKTSHLLFSSKKRPAGAFVPFIPERPVATPLSSRSSARTRSAGPDLSLSSGEHPVSSPNGHHFGGTESEVRSIDVSRSTNNLQDNPFSNKGMESPSPAETTPTLSAGVVGQSQRKARRYLSKHQQWRCYCLMSIRCQLRISILHICWTDRHEDLAMNEFGLNETDDDVFDDFGLQMLVARASPSLCQCSTPTWWLSR